MAWVFGDGFDLYAAGADTVTGYWDSAANIAGFSFTSPGRFTGSQAVRSTANTNIVKSSGVNDAVHHIAIAFQQTQAITGSSLGLYLQLTDGATAQCSIVFRSDGAILLTSGASTGTVLATYTGAFPVINTWYQFEIEVVINNTTGSFKVRKNGNSVDDFSAASLDTQNSANAYANKLQMGSGSTSITHWLDDLFWQSSSSTGTWLGDIRCHTRMPASDATVAFSRAPTSATTTPYAESSSQGVTAGTARYTPFTAAYTGNIGAATVTMGTGYTGNLKCTLFASSGTVPTTVLGSANVLANPATGSNALTFGTPVAVVAGTQYWIGFDSDTSSGSWRCGSGLTGFSSTTAYASFPVASPTTGGAQNTLVFSVTTTFTTNFGAVAEAQQDAATSYVYSSTPGQEDFYGISSIASTPATVIATTVRAYAMKSDAGTRTAAAQIKSGSTTAASPTVVLTTSGWQWMWRTDTVDPATGVAWTPAAVNTALIGPKTVA